MKTGWHPVAKLGMEAPHYPHVLVDAHGWCLRLGRERGEERYYSNLPSLLQGLIEHLTRTRFRRCPALRSAEAMLDEVRAALAEAAEGRKTLVALPAIAYPPAGRTERPVFTPDSISAR
jgi:hypothetical protein